jgi:hypothetical protein
VGTVADLSSLILMALTGFLAATLVLSVFAGALRPPPDRSEFHAAHREFLRTAERLHPISDLETFFARDRDAPPRQQ